MFALATSPLIEPRDEGAHLTDRIHQRHTPEIRRKFVVAVGKVRVANVRSFSRWVNQRLNDLYRFIALRCPHRWPVGIGDGHQIAHQPPIQRQRIRQRLLLVGAGDLKGEGVGANNSHELTIYLSSYTCKADALRCLDCRFIRRIESQNAADFCSRCTPIWSLWRNIAAGSSMPTPSTGCARSSPRSAPTSRHN